MRCCATAPHTPFNLPVASLYVHHSTSESTDNFVYSTTMLCVVTSTVGTVQYSTQSTSLKGKIRSRSKDPTYYRFQPVATLVS